VLPPLSVEAKDDSRLATAPRLFVRGFRFKGNTAFTQGDLERVLDPYCYRMVTSADLEEARQRLTLHYVNAGYITSGALLDDQDVSNGLITFTIIEGTLSEVRIEGNHWLRTNWLRGRLEARAGSPLNINQIRDELLRLKDNPNLKRINAELIPGGVRGTSILESRVSENQPFHLGVQIRNDRPPSIGAEVLEILAEDSNLTGHSDPLFFRYGLLRRTPKGAELSGVDNLGANYQVPITPHGTTLLLNYTRGTDAVIEEPFNDLIIDSDSDSYSLTIRHPLERSTQREVALGLTAERRQSETFVLGIPFSVSPGAVDGKSVVSVLRFFQEWFERDQNQVFALRSTFSVGIDVLGATQSSTNRDGLFMTWQGQAQYIRRLGGSGAQLLLSTTVQCTDDALLSLEQFVIGGASTVRGYRENQLVRDMGLVASVEFRVPVWTGRGGNPIVELAPFFDYGAGWNVGESTPPGSDLMSAGIGVLFYPHKKASARLYWGHPFRDVSDDHDDLQDYGIHFRVNVNFF
jgi:hemolysin activation/secretion protein